MFKKILAATAVAAVFIFGGASAAMAYTVAVSCTATPPSFVVGQSTTVVCTGLIPGATLFSVTGPGGTTTVEVTVPESGELTRVVTPPAAGSYTISAEDSQGNTGSVGVTVTAASTGGGGGSDLPATGGTVPAAALWLGVGAIGIGGIAVAAAVARRRAHATSSSDN